MQLDMLTSGGLGALSTFGGRYCDPQPARFGFGTQYSGSANVPELHAVLEVRPRPVMLNVKPANRALGYGVQYNGSACVLDSQHAVLGV